MKKSGCSSLESSDLRKQGEEKELYKLYVLLLFLTLS